jgi:DNA-binding beta-propeller fold protein YncE
MNRRDFLAVTLTGAAAASLPAVAWAASPPDDGALRAWSPSGQSLALWPAARRVACLDAHGRPRWRLENPDGAPDGLHYPVAAAFDEARGRVYVSDRGLGEVWVLSDSGALLERAGRGRLMAPRGLAVGADGALYVADAGHHVIWRWTPGGAWASLGGFGVGGEGLNGPVAVALDPQGRLHVADLGNRRVLRLDARSGAPRGAYAEGVAARAVALDGQGRAWVADRASLRGYDPHGALAHHAPLHQPLWRSDWS